MSKFHDNKTQTLTKMSVELGLGIKYAGINFNGGIDSKLILRKKDGECKVIDKTHEHIDDNSKMYVRMFKTMEFVTKSQIVKSKKFGEYKIFCKKNEEKKTIILEGIKSLNDVLKNMYKDGVKVSIYYEDFFENVKLTSLDGLDQFLEDAKTFKK